jgi:hypothetical protein
VRDATHGTRHPHAVQRTLSSPPSRTFSQVSKSKNSHVSATVTPLSTPWPSTRPCVISRFTASLISVWSLCSTPVTTTITTIALLNSPSKPSSRCCCSSAPQQSSDAQHQSNRCLSATQAVTRAASTLHLATFTHPHFTHSCTMPSPPPLTCSCLPS